MRVLGVDPGATATGYGLVEVTGGGSRFVDAGVIRPAGHRPLAERLLQLFEQFADCLEQHRPETVAVESLFHARSPRTAITLGHARGVILVAAARHGAALADYTPLEVKQSVTGNGAASKQQVEEMVRRLIGAPAGLAHDASDALAVALCHVHRAASFLEKA